MTMIPVNFNRIAAAFYGAAAAPVRLCESSGSDHSPDDLNDLSDLVNSFIEKGEEGCDKVDEEKENDEKDGLLEGFRSDCETKQTLKSLVCNNMCDGNQDDDVIVKQKILLQAKLACRSTGDLSSNVDGFKRRLMSRMRDNGFDAGLCKSRWEKFGEHPAGTYEYVDVNVKGSRYIIEVNLACQFQTARPTTSYTSLIDVFPQIFVGKPEELKQIVRLMCRALRESMKSKGMKVPPWRRNGYMQAKWSGHYKRTTNEISAQNNVSLKGDVVASERLAVGFETTLPRVVPYYSRDNFGCKAGLKVGYLSAAFKENGSIGVNQL